MLGIPDFMVGSFGHSLGGVKGGGDISLEQGGVQCMSPASLKSSCTSRLSVQNMHFALPIKGGET